MYVGVLICMGKTALDRPLSLGCLLRILRTTIDPISGWRKTIHGRHNHRTTMTITPDSSLVLFPLARASLSLYTYMGWCVCLVFVYIMGAWV